MNKPLSKIKEAKIKAEELRIAHHHEQVKRNDALLESDNFREFLRAIGDRGGYLDASSEQSDWMRGYRDACRDVVNGILRNSTKAALFIEEYFSYKQPNKPEVTNA